MQSIAGRVISTCRVAEHILGDARSLVAVELRFADGTVATLGCATDGQSLGVRAEPLLSLDMGESGEVVLRQSDGICSILSPGTKITRVVELVDRDRCVIGLALTTDGGERIHVYNWGDTLVESVDLPDYVLKEITDPGE